MKRSGERTAPHPDPLPKGGGTGPSLAVVGGGLAGLAAAVRAVEAGLRVELFEVRRRPGGRAGSFSDPQSGERIDHCQHVAMACCTNWLDFCRRTEIIDCFRRQPQLHFIGPDGREYPLGAFPLLPAPLHLAPAFLRLRYLSRADRWRIARTMARLVRSSADDKPGDDSIAQWLRRQGESDEAIERFWSVVLVSALGETLDRASCAAARKVFCEGFLGSRRAYELFLPREPLDEVYNRRVAAWLAGQGVRVHFGTRVRQIEGDARRASTLVLADGTRRAFDSYVAAVSWRQVRALLCEEMLTAIPGMKEVEHIEPAPITAVHLWFDRPIMPLAEAVLVGRLSQWIFERPSADDRRAGQSSERYYQVVISGSHALVGRDRQEVVDQVREELSAIWPAAREARLLRWRTVTNPEAVFSMRPGIDRLRPAQATPVKNLALAGDWTATGWPATMEGAVRSGYLAVEAILTSLGRACRLLVPDLPRGWLARWLIG